MELRPTTPNDLDFVLAEEADPDAAPFIERRARDEHERARSDSSKRASFETLVWVTRATSPLS